ncbi:divergent PAP2 family protein [Kurthia sibirica]|nr:divergent PAP2 family protein [Kurthia sibirica]GEK34690.1 membrane protein [Kurthia sibirica]
MSIFHNTPLMLAVFAIFFAQLIKIPIYGIVEKKFQPSFFLSTGGMPSSHSAAVSALTTAIGFEAGMDSPLFAVSAVFAIIVMFDATGIRFQAGQHALIINELRRDFQHLIREAKDWPEKDSQEKVKELKTLLGHKKSEMVFGAITGILISIIYYNFF